MTTNNLTALNNDLQFNNGVIESQPINNDLLESYINFELGNNQSPTTIKTYLKGMHQFFDYIKANGIIYPTPQTIIDYRTSLQEYLAPNTINSYLNVVKQFFKFLQVERIYPNITLGIKGAKVDRTEPKHKHLCIEQVQELLAQFDIKSNKIKPLRDYAIISLMVCCGLRTIEIARANIGDLQEYGNNTVLYVQGKGKIDKVQYVIVPQMVLNAIRCYLTLRGIKTFADYEKAKNEPLFCNVSNFSNGTRIVKNSISRLCKEAFKNIGLNDARITAHSLRHTACTLALENGTSLEETQQMMRHADISTTMIYNHALQREKNKGTNNVANAIFGSKHEE